MPAKTFTFRRYILFNSFVHALRSYKASARTFQMPIVVCDNNAFPSLYKIQLTTKCNR